VTTMGSTNTRNADGQDLFRQDAEEPEQGRGPTTTEDASWFQVCPEPPVLSKPPRSSRESMDPQGHGQ
jgi:hypothetical protein